MVNATPAEKKRPIRLGVLVSGRGTNLQAILDAIAAGKLHAEVAIVICNHAGAGAVTRAQAAGVACEVHELGSYTSRMAQQRAIFGKLAEVGTDLVVCAGWDRIFQPELVEQFTGRMINIHPSLLPAFGGGLHAIEDALRYGVKITGCTVHFVTAEVDSGPVISQAAVPVLPDDTLETLAERVHLEEHRLLVEAINVFAEGRLRVTGRVVRVDTPEMKE